MKKHISLLLVATLLLGYLGIFPLPVFAEETASAETEAAVEALVIETVPSVTTVAEGTCGENLTWTLDTEGTLTISGEGAMAEYYGTENLPWYSYKSDVIKVVIEDGVTALDGYGYIFFNYENLAEVHIGNSLTVIPDSAFGECYNLTTVELGAVSRISQEVFSYCYALSSITIPASVTEISVGGFYECRALTEIFFDGSAPAILDYAFHSATANAYYYPDESWTEEVRQDYGGTLTWLERQAATDDLTWELTDGVLTITGEGDMADYTQGTAPWYESAASITRVEIGSQVRTVGSFAFYGCSALKTVVFSGNKASGYSNLNSVGANAFDGCTALETVYIFGWTDLSVSGGNEAFLAAKRVTPDDTLATGQCGDDVTWTLSGYGTLNISGTGPMWNYTGNEADENYRLEITQPDGLNIPITNVFVDEGITSVGDYAFFMWEDLEDANLEEGVVSIGSNAFSGCSKLSRVVLRDGLEQIGDNAFAYTALTSVSVPPFVAVENAAFYMCKSLTKAHIPVGVDRIGMGMFFGCEALTEVTVPATVTSIERYAFSGCLELKTVNFLGTQEAWEKVTVGDGNEPLDTAEITFATVSGQCGESMTWAFEETSGTLTISGTGDMYTVAENMEAFWNGEYLYEPGWWKLPVTHIVVEEGVQNLSDWAFFQPYENYYEAVQSVELPDMLEAIPQLGFLTATAIKTIKIPEGITSLTGWPFGSPGNSFTTAETLYLPSTLTELDPYTVIASGVNSRTGELLLKKIVFAGTKEQWNSIAHVQSDPMKESWGDEADSMYAQVEEMLATIPVVCAEEDDAVHSGLCGQNTTWTLNEAGVLTISGTGPMDDCGEANAPWSAHKDSITAVVIESGVTYIGAYNFYNYGKLISITIAGTVTQIGNDAFSDCTAMTSVAFSDGVTAIGDYAFYNCAGLTGVEIPDSVKTIGEGAFSLCSGLTTVTIGSGVTSLGSGVFAGCTSLVKVAVDDENSRYYSENNIVYNSNGTTLVLVPGGYVGSVDVPTGVRTIGELALYSCAGVTAVNLPYGVRTIDAGAFYGCVSLSDMALPGSVDVIGEFAFAACTSLTSIAIPKNVTAIGEETFTYCLSLNSVTIPASVTEIGAYAFYACDALKLVSYGGSETKLNELEVAEGNDPLYMAQWYINCELMVSAVPDPATGRPKLSWNSVPYATKYEIWRATKIDGNYTRIKTVSEYSYTDTSAVLGTEYYYQVAAVFSEEDYLAVGVTSARRVCAQPAVKYTISTLTGRPTLSWGAVTGASKYEILRAESLNGEYTLLATQTGRSFTDTTAQGDTVYYYKVNVVAAKAGANSVDMTPLRIACAVAQPSIKTTVFENGKPQITWGAVSGAVSYKVYRATSSKGTYTEIGTTSELSFVDETAEVAKLYYYKVSACGTVSESVQSDYKSIRCCADSTTITVTRIDASGKPVISWEAVEGAKKYEVHRAVKENGTYTRQTTTTSLTYTDTGAAPGSTYYYKVYAVPASTAAKSVASNVGSMFTVCAQPAVKYTISTLTGRPTLSWGAVTGASKYEILRAESLNGEYTLLATQTGRSFTDTTAQGDTVYYYKVNVVAAKAGANSVDMTPLRIACAVAQPSIKISVFENGKPQITWGAVSGAVSYKVYRATSSKGTYTEIGTTAELSFVDETAEVAKLYYYKVSACGTVSESVQSDYKSIRCCADSTTITVTRSDASGKPVITWEAVEGAKKYEVHRAASENGRYTRRTTTTSLSYTDTGATPGYTYYYKVYVVPASTAAKSVASNVGAMFTICAQPNVKVTYSTTGQHTLSWSRVTGASKYEVLRAESAEGPYTLLTTQKGTSYTDKNTTADTLYYYKVNVISTKTGANSVDMEPLAVARAIARPTISKLTNDAASGKPVLTWKAIDGAVSYNIYRAASSKGTYTIVGNTDTLSFVDETAAVNKTYYYKVSACGMASESAQTAYKSIRCKCAAPQGAVTVENGDPVISCETVDGARKYEIYRATSENGRYTRVKTTTECIWTDTSAKAGTTYYYKIKAIASSSSANSAYSEIFSCTAN